MSPHELGRRAELAVADYLFVGGFELLARNLRLGPLEIDLVARRGALVVMTEVRTRGATSFVGPFASVTRTKRLRLRAAADRLWRERLARIPSIERVRVDVAAVTFRGKQTLVDYAEDALGLTVV
jgi:putative endonuclease